MSPGRVDPLRYLRRDVSAVPHQGGYVAKQCPVVAHLRYDPTNVADKVPYPEALQRRFDAGRLFEADVFAELRVLHPTALVFDPDERDLIEPTFDAMRRGVALIVGGQLPNDDVGRRVGKPDIVVRVEDASIDGNAWSYVPVDVKHHLTLQPSVQGAFGPPQCSPLGSPTLTDPNVGYPRWLIHRDRGVTTRSDLATLDARTASLLDAGVDLARWRQQAATLLGDTPVDAIPVEAPKQLHALLDSEIRTVGDVLGLDVTTAEYSGAPISNLTKSIDLARLGISNTVARARGVTEIVVPSADVELDIDLESAGERVYLWGTLVSGDLPEVAVGYLPFAAFDVLDDGGEAELFVSFWSWLTDVRRAAVDAGLSMHAYCHSGPSAENRQLRSACRRFEGRAGIPTLEEVDAFLASEQWIDMREVVTSQLVTPFGTGLKALATYAGFEWRDDDPGGEQSLAWYELATADADERVRTENQQRLLDYNEDDCRATRHLREWLSQESPSIPSLEDFD